MSTYREGSTEINLTIVLLLHVVATQYVGVY